jgi:hypothetical protein
MCAICRNGLAFGPPQLPPQKGTAMLEEHQRRAIRAIFKANTNNVIDILQVKAAIKAKIDVVKEHEKVAVGFRFDQNACCFYITPAGVMAVGYCIDRVAKDNQHTLVESQIIAPSVVGYHPLD